ncbi:MAG TPA: bifunctional precorrin-2 dehydrogenase/sirohydrochlorin ferrochelatase [Thermoanaerobaculia bacterium]|nr:bifunctional precorrin-2 dehydrogenase/sirohydrochlorin ferrochelatase [Thermoanaerobaculia bacterium]
MSSYPITLDLAGRLAVVLGAGRPAPEKIEGLLAAGARVRLIAPEPCERLFALAATGAIQLLARTYREGDLSGAWLVIAIPEELEPQLPAIAREAEARRIFLNVIDRPPLCSFAAPAIARRGDLTVAISTAGRAPALAARIRDRIARRLGPELERFLEIAGRARAPLAARRPDFGERRARWYALVDSDALRLLRSGRELEAHRRFEEILGIELPEAWP